MPYSLYLHSLQSRMLYKFPRVELALNAPEWRIFHHYRLEKGCPGQATKFPAKNPAMAPLSLTVRPQKRESLSRRLPPTTP
jgi:hypothetical protein